jgi:heptaprenyl diphosphate synthase
MGIHAITTSPTQKIAKLGILTAFALIIFIFESLIPRPLPWAKPGLANIVAIYILLEFGFKDALVVNLARIIAGSLILGRFFTPSFLLSLGAGITSVTAMYLAKPAGFGVVGLSLIGAIFHSFTQLLLASLIIIDASVMLKLTPIMLINATITGLFTGFILAILLPYLPTTQKTYIANHGTAEN